MNCSDQAVAGLSQCEHQKNVLSTVRDNLANLEHSSLQKSLNRSGEATGWLVLDKLVLARPNLGLHLIAGLVSYGWCLTSLELGYAS